MKGVIFDLDGVLVTTDRYHYEAWKKVADEKGIYFDEEINHRLRGISRMQSLEIILERYGGVMDDNEKKSMAEKKNSYYLQYLSQMDSSHLSGEVKGTLDALRGRGYKLAVGSSSRNARFILERIGLGDYFDAVSDGTNISKSKPDPEVFLKASEMLGERPDELLVVEDARGGIEAAVAGGFHSAAIGDAVSHGGWEYALGGLADLLKILA